MSPRFPLVTEPDPSLAPMFERPLVSRVDNANALRLLANHPQLLLRFSGLAAMFASQTSLPPLDLELVILRTAYRSRCEYEFAQHRDRAAEAGLTEEQLQALCRDDPGEWPEREAALIALADEIVRDAVVSDATWDRLRPTYDDQQLIELLFLPGFYRMVAGMFNTAGVAVDEGLPRWDVAD